MAGHVDQHVVVRAPLEVTWRLSNEHERWAADRHRLFDASDDGRRIVFQVTTPPDRDGRTWTYSVDRCMYPDRHLVYSRRFDNPAFAYSVAWWIYSEVDEGTRVRCVQDFEVSAGAPVDDRQMEETIAAGTAAALGRMAERVESAVAGASDSR